MVAEVRPNYDLWSLLQQTQFVHLRGHFGSEYREGTLIDYHGRPRRTPSFGRRAS